MSFNPQRNKQATEIIFSDKEKSPNHANIYFENCGVSTIYTTLWYDSNLNFEQLLSEKIYKVNRGLFY